MQTVGIENMKINTAHFSFIHSIKPLQQDDVIKRGPEKPLNKLKTMWKCYGWVTGLCLISQNLLINVSYNIYSLQH